MIGRSTSTRGRQHLRAALVLTQVAVSCMLLIGAGLMLRSFLKLQQENPGFRARPLLTVRLTPNFSHYMDTEDLTALWKNVLANVQRLGGVESAALATNFPFNPVGIVSGPNTTEFELEDQRLAKGQVGPLLDFVVVSSGYFNTIGQRIVAGRSFNDHDNEKSEKVAIVNETLAHHRWPDGNPIGKRVTLDHGKTWLKIAGIAGDVREYGLDRAPGDELYAPLLQSNFANRLLIRTSQDPMSMWPSVRTALRQADPQLAVDQVTTMDRLRDDSVASPRLTMLLLGIFAGLALVVTGSGIAAVMALAVSQRTNELGIRMALGAQRNSVLLMIVRQGVVLALAGTAIGITGALILTRLLGSLLYATSPTDAVTFAAVAVLFVSVAMVACVIPARRATGIDPYVALRQE